MQKKLIALAVASALTLPAVALADTGNVTIYGTANVSYDFVNSGNAIAQAGKTSQRVSSNQSNIGLKGSEDLGGGLTAVWQVESMVDISGAGNGYTGNGLATRNTFIGLSSGSMGTLVLGRHDTPYKIATRGLDQFADGIADNRSLMGRSTTQLAFGGSNTSFDGRQPNVIAYISPAMAGLTVAVGHVNLNNALQGTAGLNATQFASTDSKADAWSLAGLYGNGPFFASLAYETHDVGTGTTGLGGLVAANGGIALKEKAYKVGLGYTQDAFNVGFAYEKTQDNMGGVCNAVVGAAISANGQDCAGHKAYYLGGKYNISSSDAVKLAYTHMGKLAATGLAGVDTSAKQWTLGYDHSMSKRTTLYALYTQLSNGNGAAYGLSNNASSVTTDGVVPGGGFSPAQGAGTSVTGAAGSGGAKPYAVSIGMKHTF